MARRAPFIERFWRKVRVEPGGCWQWTGAISSGKSSGYGNIRVDGVTRGAHRAAYEYFVGPVPDGMQLDHLCRNRACVNPAHLEPVTQRVNILRGNSPSALLARQTHCKRGHPFDAVNTRMNGGGRVCRACVRLMQSAASRSAA